MKKNPYHDEFVGYSMIGFIAIAAVLYLVFLTYYDPVDGNKGIFGWIYIFWVLSSIGAMILSIIQIRKKIQLKPAIISLVVSAIFLALFFWGLGQTDNMYEDVLQEIDLSFFDECKNICPEQSTSYKMNINPEDKTDATCFCFDENENIIHEQKI